MSLMMPWIFFLEAFKEGGTKKNNDIIEYGIFRFLVDYVTNVFILTVQDARGLVKYISLLLLLAKTNIIGSIIHHHERERETYFPVA